MRKFRTAVNTPSLTVGRFCELYFSRISASVRVGFSSIILLISRIGVCLIFRTAAFIPMAESLSLAEERTGIFYKKNKAKAGLATIVFLRAPI